MLALSLSKIQKTILLNWPEDISPFLDDRGSRWGVRFGIGRSEDSEGSGSKQDTPARETIVRDSFQTISFLINEYEAFTRSFPEDDILIIWNRLNSNERVLWLFISNFFCTRFNEYECGFLYLF